MIAGTYTPIVVIVLSDFARVAMLAAIWTLALAGVVVVVRRISTRHGILIGLYLALGGDVCLDAFTQAHVKNNHASTSDDDIFGDFTTC